MAWIWECGEVRGRTETLESDRHELKHCLHCSQVMWLWEMKNCHWVSVFPSMRVSQYHFLHMADVRIIWDQIRNSPPTSTELSSLNRMPFLKHKKLQHNTNHFYPSDISEIKLYNKAIVFKQRGSVLRTGTDQWYRLGIPTNCLINSRNKFKLS